MSRTIKEIYNEAVQERNRRLELTEFASDSKLSVMNGILWTVAAVIYSFETLLDVFAVDISEAINNRINGTPDYYANALLQYQQGDELTVREDGLAFGYAQVDETKRIITQVSYVESTDDSNLDSKLVLKIATGTKGHLEAIPAEELVPINAYIGKLKFAGTRIEVISTKGDVLVPRLTVFYDGAVPEAEMYDSIETRIRDYIMGIDFDAAVCHTPCRTRYRRLYRRDGNPRAGRVYCLPRYGRANPAPATCRPHDIHRLGLPERVLAQGRGVGTADLPGSHHAQSRKP